ncbi:MAG: NAD(+) synthetase, partial [Anaerolineae bacterium]|nr:NAD(+) synthetase [Anaerolineae bacterium]
MNCQKVVDVIAAWIAKQIEAANVDGIVIGLSGGIDSTVVAALAHSSDVRITGVVMPCGSDPQDSADAYLGGAADCDEVVELDLTA